MFGGSIIEAPEGLVKMTQLEKDHQLLTELVSAITQLMEVPYKDMLVSDRPEAFEIYKWYDRACRRLTEIEQQQSPDGRCHGPLTHQRERNHQQ